MNTCFMPTAYLDPHIGHAWIAWHNWDLAQRTGGRFNLIFDDVCHAGQHLYRYGFGVQTAMRRWQAQLKWFGLVADAVHVSSDNHEAHVAAWARLGIKPPVESATGNLRDHEIFGALWCEQADAYHPAHVARWVVDDHIAEVDGWFNGWQFLAERQLYDYFSRCLGYRPIRQSHLPHIRREANSQKESKSADATSIFELRDAGYTAQQILDTLRECDRVSRAAGLIDTVIPRGILEPETVGVLEYQWPRLEALSNIKEARGHPWSRAVRAAVGSTLKEG